MLESAPGAASDEAADGFVATESDMVTLVAFAFAKNAPERRASGHSTAHGHRMKKNRRFSIAANPRLIRSDATGWRSTVQSKCKRLSTSGKCWCCLTMTANMTATAAGMKTLASDREEHQPASPATRLPVRLSITVG